MTKSVGCDLTFVSDHFAENRFTHVC